MIVADTNVVVPLLLEHEMRPHALALYTRDADWHLPDWWQVELANVLRNYHRARAFSSEQVDLLLDRARHIFPPQNTHATDLAQALRIACNCDISAYDACFIALARGLGRRLVTEDTRLRKACPDDTISLDQALASLD